MVDNSSAAKTCTVDNCSRPSESRGWCRQHHRRWQRHGTPTGGVAERCRGSVADRLDKFRRRDGDSGCWEWQGRLKSNGYGVITLGVDGKRKSYLAHRVAWEVANGRPIPDGLFVLHACDNPPCTNPAHLSVGTHAENMRQMRDRGRSGRRTHPAP